MKYYGILFILIGILIIIFPDLIAYIFGFFLIFLGLNMFFISKIISSNFKTGFYEKDEEGNFVKKLFK